jgi:hypothetical protein
MNTQVWALPLAPAGLALAAFIGVALAENIDPFNDDSQFAWSENAGWLASSSPTVVSSRS